MEYEERKERAKKREHYLEESHVDNRESYQSDFSTVWKNKESRSKLSELKIKALEKDHNRLKRRSVKGLENFDKETEEESGLLKSKIVSKDDVPDKDLQAKHIAKKLQQFQS